MFYHVVVLIFMLVPMGLVQCDPNRECVIWYPIEIKFDKWLQNVLQSGSYPDFTGDTVFNNISILTRVELFVWNSYAIKRAKLALDKHFNRQAEMGQPQYKFYQIGPVTSYCGQNRGEIKLRNVRSDGFSRYQYPEFVVRARKQTSVAEELTCDENIAERNDLIYYLEIGFSYENLALVSEFGINESSVDGELTVTLSNLWVKIFLQIKEIDDSGNFRCTTDDSIFPSGYTHRAPEFTVQYNLENIETEIKKYPTDTAPREVDDLLNHIKNEILEDNEAIERRLWAHLLPAFTKHVMKMKSVKDVIEILYYVAQNNPNPTFSFTEQGVAQRPDDFLSFN